MKIEDSFSAIIKIYTNLRELIKLKDKKKEITVVLDFLYMSMILMSPG
jgi:hypothetical protein